MSDAILENRIIDAFARRFDPPPHRLNGLHEADAELIALETGSGRLLAVTTDALAEEAASGLYDDPKLLGWMLVQANFSDLAAVGADPLGILVAVTYPATAGDEDRARLAEGISEACGVLGTYVLGGDTNQGREWSLCGTALGLVPRSRTVTRRGARPGDKLYVSAPCGQGSAYAFLKLFGRQAASALAFFKPVARLAEGRVVREQASSAMDTSDGLLHTADTLARLNHCRIVLSDDWGRSIHPVALEICRAQKFPAWLALASVHGEFELCFTLPPENEAAFRAAAARVAWQPVCVGEVEAGEGVWIRNGKDPLLLDTARIRNLAAAASSDPASYVTELIQYAREIGR